jgi:prepilin-type N-terminal cleavage/methylation domain-containing protein
MLKIRNRRSASSGFTLIEVVIAISLIVLLTTVLLSSFGPWLRYKQRLDTETRLHDISQSITALYKANASSIDDTDSPGTISSSVFGHNVGALKLVDGRVLSSNCPASTVGFDPADTLANQIEGNLASVQPYAAMPVASIARDGFNNGICLVVSPRQLSDMNGARVQYHSVAVIALGEGSKLDNLTSFGADATGHWVLTLDPNGSNRGVVVDGYQIQAENIKITRDRLVRFAKAYETYFNIHYLSNPSRDITLDYFYKDDGTNQGNSTLTDLGNVVLPSYVSVNAWTAGSFADVLSPSWNLAANLGISMTESRDAWGQPILFDNRSGFVRAGERNGVALQPPFSAVFLSLIPGSSSCTGRPSDSGSSCASVISATAMSTY